MLDLAPGSLVTLLTDEQVINLRVVNVRERMHSVTSADIPADAAVLGVTIEPPSRRPPDPLPPRPKRPPP